MPVCPACASEYRPGYSTCAVCGVPLGAPPDPDPVESGEARSVRVRFRAIYATGSFTQAFALRAYLEENGIPAFVENEHSWNHVLGIPVSAIPLVVAVSETDRPDAEEALRLWLAPEGPGIEGSWKPADGAFWPWPASTALLLLSLDPSSAGRVDPWVMAWLSWIAVHAAVVSRLAHLSVAPVAVAFGWGAGFGILLSGALLALGTDSEALKDLPLRHFLFTGPVEEFGKVLGPLVLAAAIRSFRRDRESRMALAAWSAFGFATLENLGYLAEADSSISLGLFINRAVSLLHIALTLFVAAGRPAELPLRLLAAAFLHGAWNHLMEADLVWIGFAVFGIGLALIVHCLRRSERAPRAAAA